MLPVPTRLCIVRHGETDWNAGKRIQGQIDIPLSSLGHAQARATGNALKNEGFAAIYSSDLLRAKQTAEATAHIAPHFSQVPVRLHSGLRERHFGLLQGLTYEEAMARHPLAYAQHRGRNPHFVPAGGESLLDLAARLAETFDEIVRAHAGESVLLFTHGGVLDIVYRQATAMSLEAPRNFAIPNCAINWVEVLGSGWTLLSWAERDHLAIVVRPDDYRPKHQ